MNMDRVSVKGSIDYVLTVERAMRTIELLSDADEGLSVSEIARQLAVNKSIAFRILSTLDSLRYVYQHNLTQRYRLTFRVSNLALRQMANSGLLDQCVPVLRNLADKTGELVRLAIIENGRPVWIHAESGPQRRLRIDPVYGHEVTLHTHATAKAWLLTLTGKEVRAVMGSGPFEAYTKFTITTLRALLTDLAAARRLGYALSFEEHELGVGTIAAPIIINGVKQEMRCVGIVSVAAPTSRMDRAALLRCGPVVSDTARNLGAAWPFELLPGTPVLREGAQRAWGHRN